MNANTMKRWWMAGVLSALAATSAVAALKDGDAAPDFKLQASRAGKAFDYKLTEALKKGPVVVYFYPSAFTGGCNIQAHTFAVNHDKFAAAGASIVGVSLDSIERLNAFSADPESCAGKVTVASDVGGRVARAFDLSVADTPAGRKDTRGVEIDHGRVERTTFVVARDGRIAGQVSGAAPVANVERALKIVQGLQHVTPPGLRPGTSLSSKP